MLGAGPEGSLWVLSGRGAWRPPEGSCAVFDVWDGDGHLSGQVALKAPSPVQPSYASDFYWVRGPYFLVAHGARSDMLARPRESHSEDLILTCYGLDRSMRLAERR